MRRDEIEGVLADARRALPLLVGSERLVRERLVRRLTDALQFMVDREGLPEDGDVLMHDGQVHPLVAPWPGDRGCSRSCFDGHTFVHGCGYSPGA